MSYGNYYTKCIVCGKRKEYGRKPQFFKFPYEVERCRSWVKAIGIRDLLYMPLEKLRQQYVCAAHFDPGCINARGDRLHKVAIPYITLYSPLSDQLMSDFPKMRSMSVKAPVSGIVRSAAAKERIQALDLDDVEPVIDYDRPLMESLGTLAHNERHFVKMPAGILNSIAVPLMSYSSSLEKGNVFAAADPGGTFDLPFVPFIEPSSYNYNEPSNKYLHVKSIAKLQGPRSTLEDKRKPLHSSKTVSNSSGKIITHSKFTNNSDVSLIPNTLPTEKPQVLSHYTIPKKTLVGTLPTEKPQVLSHYTIPKKTLVGTLPTEKPQVLSHYTIPKKTLVGTLPTEKPQVLSDYTIPKKTLVGTVKPTIKTVDKIAKRTTKKNFNVSIGLNTLITGHPRKATNSKNTTNSNVKMTESVFKPNTDSSGRPLKGIKQYSNKKLNTYKNVSLQSSKISVHKTSDSMPKTDDFNIAPKNKIENLTHTNPFADSFVPTNRTIQYCDSPENIIRTDLLDTPATITSNRLEPNLSSTNTTDLLFVPYTQYEVTASPESKDAHIGEGTLDYGLPLMNCIGTVFQGNIQSKIKTPEVDSSDESVIEVPLMKCLKTLENSSLSNDI